MSHYPYSRQNHKLWFTGKETAFRENASGADTWKADAVVYPMPVIPERVVTYKKKLTGVYYIDNEGPDPGLVQEEGYTEGVLEVSGPLMDFSLMYFLCKACTTTDATPGAGKYTHVYATSTARTATPPSFQLVRKLENDTAAQGIWLLYTGCVCSYAKISGSVGSNVLQGTFRIKFANQIYSETDLSGTQTARSGLRAYTYDTTAITFTKATAAYQADKMGFEIEYDDGTMLVKADNETLPGRAYNGPRKITCKLTMTPKEKAVLYDFALNDLAPLTASDLDCTIKTSRNATNDYLSFAFEKLIHIDRPDWSFSQNDYHLTMDVPMLIKPTSHETGAKLTITEVNVLTDDRYET